ncbi:MAG: tRNA uridine(34) 5-carboxymethylaminomethyl modification radical SAM/GNAT enzyme Elp3 [Thermoproteota archaeon]|nr:MAG: tRNA uridine(34) 5-carboxymethylaminomethyl modification radical SAM/GNAT enzyme Elp3 [Candidatus Korarchaeota archaeon]
MMEMAKAYSHLAYIQDSIPKPRKKPSRSASGVVVVAVMCKPMKCPKSEPCIFCPGGPGSVFGDTPQSYTGLEPAARRAAQAGFDPRAQVAHRIRQLEEIGHVPSKIELIVMGGTFLGAPKEYREWFIKECYDAVSKSSSRTLREAILRGEHSSRRIVALTIETRPDYCRESHVDEMLRYGCTRVEIGAQALRDDLLEATKRGHSRQDIIDAIRVAKDAGLKVVLHMMPGLPGSTPRDDFKDFMELFENPELRPDGLKIYPTLVLKGTKLYEMWERGEYQPYTLEEHVNLLAQVKAIIPRYVRIYRIQRDIPSNLIVDGVKKSNLRQIVQEYMGKLGLRCMCIRCREVGRVSSPPHPSLLELKVMEYEASGGIEMFLEVTGPEDQLVGFLRLRIPSDKAHRSELSQGDIAVVRELRVYGTQIPIGHVGGWQHRGVGLWLMREAERIVRDELLMRKLAVTAGVGAREYFAKLGYRKKGPYMVKLLR